MREILFRGKRLDNGEWVTGAFLNDRDGAFYICPVVSDITYGDNGNRRRIGCWYAVDPSTVGQYTGLIDKNGKRIFEGDIIPVWEHGEKYFYKVVYCGDCFMLSMLDSEQGSYPLSVKNNMSEVLGNIHDNPELLEGGAEQ